MKFLISGTASGLGKHLFQVFNGISYTHDTPTENLITLQKKGVDIIIHAASNSSNNVTSKDLYSYIEDNIFLTKKLLKIPHKKFIFISSVDVYPKDGKEHNEEEIININSVSGIYAITKLVSESLVKKLSSNYLILRCSAMLGKYSRKNSLIKIMQENKPVLSLSEKSNFNYILHYDISEFIKIATEKNLIGIYNLASADNISLLEVAKFFEKRVKFGNYIYTVGTIDNNRAASLLPHLRKKSKELIEEFSS